MIGPDADRACLAEALGWIRDGNEVRLRRYRRYGEQFSHSIMSVKDGSPHWTISATGSSAKLRKQACFRGFSGSTASRAAVIASSEALPLALQKPIFAL